MTSDRLEQGLGCEGFAGFRLRGASSCEAEGEFF